MKFNFYKFPSEPTPAFPNRKNILVPLLRMKLKNDTREIGCLALIDSGADCCLFPAELGEAIGLKIRNQNIQEVQGIGGGKIIAYFHKIILIIGQSKFHSYIGFTYNYLPMPALGRNGFFDLFRISFDLKKEIFELKPYKLGKV